MKLSDINTLRPSHAPDRLVRPLTQLLQLLTLVACSCPSNIAFASPTANANLIDLGRTLFQDTSLSRDGHTSCQSCHDPAHAYADPHPRSIGIEGRAGTRNAPSLIGIGDDTSFMWDGRRSRLEDAVLDPFTNPVELGLASTDEIVERMKRAPAVFKKFGTAFPNATEAPSLDQVRSALVAFIQSLRVGSAPYDKVAASPLTYEAEHGRQLFEGISGCNACHSAVGTTLRFSDGQYHHSGVGKTTQSPNLPELVRTVLSEHPDDAHLGHKVLANPDWSSLGRFVVSRRPIDIGAFRTPSLRNVAVTAPYMHDGSIATLKEAVDHEIYYRAFSSGRTTTLSLDERQAIVAFLETLTDTEYTSDKTTMVQPSAANSAAH
ncbi:MAG: cytochrome c peroxidase [Dokdonella sp.]